LQLQLFIEQVKTKINFILNSFIFLQKYLINFIPVTIFNKINPAIEEVLYEQLSNQAEPTSIPLELKGISEVFLGLMEEVIAIKDVDKMLSFIYEKKRVKWLMSIASAPFSS
jgi:hypothetical protein